MIHSSVYKRYGARNPEHLAEILLAKLEQAPTQQPLTEAQTELATEAVDQIMEQSQVFASAWSLVGGRFDNGDGMDNADNEKAKLRTMVVSLAQQAASNITGSKT